MNRGGSSYDESLLRDAPVATREQLQEGYNPDILIAPTRHRSVHHPQPIQQTPSGAAPPVPPVPLSSSTDLEQGNTIPGGNSSNAYSPLNEKLDRGRRKPFWRTTGGIVAIIIVILIILGGAIGGGVGGTRKHGNSQLSSSSNSSGQSTSNGGNKTGIGGVSVGPTGDGATSTVTAPRGTNTAAENHGIATPSASNSQPLFNGAVDLTHDHLTQMPDSPLAAYAG
ncbi:hypothetical protein AX15_005933 [Amanita polypyramis BW_CC]|nr:hypothetical protein AX15_005933 [Amanita polypyramis BW_CC]